MDSAPETSTRQPTDSYGSDSARLEAFAAAALDWDEVRGLFERYLLSSLGRRALAELVPRSDAGAREAIARARELCGRPAPAPPMAGLSDPRPGLERAAEFGRSLEEGELAALVRFVAGVITLRSWLVERGEELVANARLAVTLPDLSGLRDRMDRTLDERGVLRRDASPLLEQLRTEIESLEREVDRRARQVAASGELRAALADGHAGRVHRRGGRPCLAVRAKARGRVSGIVHDRSQSGETLFVEPEAVVEAGNRLAGARVEESREVARILGELTRDVLRRSDELQAAAHIAGELELAQVAAGYADDQGARLARLPGEPGASPSLLLKEMRHPLLLEQQRSGQLDAAEPIDLRLGEDFDLLVVTGPNTGGKTLALKSAGVATLLTRMGLPIPCADGTTVPLYDGIVADVGDEQEVRQNLSTFSSHLMRIQRGLERITPMTLVLLDELGGGTDPAEGAALGDALLETLLARRVPTIATTHIGKLKEFAFRNARAENASAEFDLETLRPLYRLTVGAPGESRALAIARRIGLDEGVVSRAEERLEKPEAEAHLLMQQLRGSREEAERMRGMVEGRLRDVERELEGQVEERDQLVRKRDLLESEAQRDLESRVRRARPALERLRALTEQLAPAQRAALEPVLAELESSLDGVALSESRERFLQGLSKGQLVYLPRYKKRCSILRVDRKRRQVTVRLGNQKLSVSYDDVSVLDGQ